MNYTIYKIRGTNLSSGRSKKYEIKAVAEDVALETGRERGLLEPFVEEVIPHDEPTERQLAYAADLGIEVALGVKREDVSELINIKLNNDEAAPQALIDFATARKLCFSTYIGFAGLCRLIFYKLDGNDKAAFFVFRVYLHLSRDEVINLDANSEQNFMYHIGESLLKNEKLYKSMLSYEGENLTFFGERTVNYTLLNGGSQNTAAYKFVAKAVSNQYGTKKTRSDTIIDPAYDDDVNSDVSSIESPPPELTQTQATVTGCLGLGVIAVTIYLISLLF